jgi:hypothetical protein
VNVSEGGNAEASCTDGLVIDSIINPMYGNAYYGNLFPEQDPPEPPQECVSINSYRQVQVLAPRTGCRLGSAVFAASAATSCQAHGCVGGGRRCHS